MAARRKSMRHEEPAKTQINFRVGHYVGDYLRHDDRSYLCVAFAAESGYFVCEIDGESPAGSHRFASISTAAIGRTYHEDADRERFPRPELLPEIVQSAYAEILEEPHRRVDLTGITEAHHREVNDVYWAARRQFAAWQERASASALEIATWLAGRPGVALKNPEGVTMNIGQWNGADQHPAAQDPDRWSAAEEYAAGHQAIENLCDSSQRSKRELRILEAARQIVGTNHYIGDGPRAWVDPDALRVLRVALGHDGIRQAGEPDRPLTERIARAAHLRADQVRRLLGAMADLVDDQQAGELTAGTTAAALVCELERHLGTPPTRRQVEELCLAHMSVAADLAHLANGWENDAAEDFSPEDSAETAQAPPWRRVIADWQEAEG